MKSESQAAKEARAEMIALDIGQIWRKSRPNLYQMMKDEGNLRETLLLTAEAVMNMEEGLLSQGNDVRQANKIAMEELVYLPDVGEIVE